MRVPWYAKIVAKIILSRLPFGYSFWRRRRVFVHGSMSKPEYAWRVLREHLDQSKMLPGIEGRVVLELGPGDSVFSALIAHALGAKRCLLVDSGNFAVREIEPYQQALDFIKSKGISISPLDSSKGLESLLNQVSGTYLTEGLTSLRRIESESVDFVFSQAVLEHIRRSEFRATVAELRRILRRDGKMSHEVDLKDHLGGALNHLRFPSQLWEADWMAKSGFYTNRITFSAMLAIFEEEGFSPQIKNRIMRPAIPMARNRLAQEFRSVPEQDLLTASFSAVFVPV
jgi:SAM-dependent methyltransferase